MPPTEDSVPVSAEQLRLADDLAGSAPWRRWGPYLSERQWGTVREDYSDEGDAWSYFTHDQARSRAYRWGEDGLAGFCDDQQELCLAIALWNGRDPILKERLFGVTNAEGNHGEDVKEYYFYLDAVPTHVYNRWLYKYPQAAYPYEDLVLTNRTRSRDAMEYELVDTGVFDEQRYFDVSVEYAKVAPDDLVTRITVTNRGPEAATLHVLPTVWFRNTWSWGSGDRPVITAADDASATVAHPRLGELVARFAGSPELVLTHNESNRERLWGEPNVQPYVKDAFHRYVIEGDRQAVNPARTGTKLAAVHVLELGPGEERTLHYRLCPAADDPGSAVAADIDAVVDLRRAEADAFYETITPAGLDSERRSVMRQALAGMLWTKQYYYFDVDQWLRERGQHPWMRPARQGARNAAWFHMVNDDIISMPDKWEYPWYAAWDLAFHCVSFALVDPAFAKAQLGLMLSELYLHPSGQIPAYEWNFGDVNPPVHAWATLFVYAATAHAGVMDTQFLKESFQKLLMNFTWWLNRKDPSGNNVFEGGFLGLDNIGVFDRSHALPTGGRLEQADGTGWMALFSQNMLEIALELAKDDPAYEDVALRFVRHFFRIAASMDRLGDNDDELWDEEDGFFYDVLRLPDGTGMRLKVRSMVGLLPLCAVTVVPIEVVRNNPRLLAGAREMWERKHDLLTTMHDPSVPGKQGRLLLSALNEDKLRRVLTRMLDEDRFLSPYGIRSLSKWHEEHPYEFTVHGETFRVQYEPAESRSGMFGGNSNWRGPVWLPVNLLIIRALLQYYLYYGDDFRIECPTGSGREMNLFEVAREIADRLVRIFVPGDDGRRPLYGGTELFQDDPHWKDLVLFYEYFHGDDGAGLGASHQTGWTGLVAKLIQMIAVLDPDETLHGGSRPLTSYYHRPTA
jgi:hypothetical protein